MYKKGMAAALVLAIGAISFSGDADARQRWHRGYNGHHGYHGHHGGAFAAGALGFGAGALLGSALAAPRYYAPRYYEPAPVYVQPAPVYVQPSYAVGPAAWSPDWYAYCSSRYRSFNPQTGYYLGYDGQYHLCR